MRGQEVFQQAAFKAGEKILKHHISSLNSLLAIFSCYFLLPLKTGHNHTTETGNRKNNYYFFNLHALCKIKISQQSRLALINFPATEQEKLMSNRYFVE